MPSRAHLKAAELMEEERQMNELNASLERQEQRERIAAGLAYENYASDDVVVEPPDEGVESVDGGYWVKARLWVDADDVEERMEP